MITLGKRARPSFTRVGVGPVSIPMQEKVSPYVCLILPRVAVDTRKLDRKFEALCWLVGQLH